MKINFQKAVDNFVRRLFAYILILQAQSYIHRVFPSAKKTRQFNPAITCLISHAGYPSKTCKHSNQQPQNGQHTYNGKNDGQHLLGCSPISGSICRRLPSGRWHVVRLDVLRPSTFAAVRLPHRIWCIPHSPEKILQPYNIILRTKILIHRPNIMHQLVSLMPQIPQFFQVCSQSCVPYSIPIARPHMLNIIRNPVLEPIPLDEYLIQLFIIFQKAHIEIHHHFCQKYLYRR